MTFEFFEKSFDNRGESKRGFIITAKGFRSFTALMIEEEQENKKSLLNLIVGNVMNGIERKRLLIL